MEPFKITCVTCSARLAVRDEAIIGHIVACPRCGSMVQVTAPAVGAASSATPSHVTPALALPVAAASVFDVADVGPSLEDIDAGPVPAEDMQPPAGLETAAGGASGFKLAAIILAGALVGSALVAGTLMWLAGDEAPVSVTQSERSSAAAAPVVLDRSSEEAESVAEAAESAAEEDDNVEPPVAISAPDETTAEEPAAEDSAASEIANPHVPQTPSAPNTEAPDTAVAAASSEPPAAAAAPAPKLRIDPLEIDPEGLDLSTLFHGRPAEPVAVSEVDEPVAAAVESDAPVDAVEEPAAVRRDADGGGAPGDVAVLLARQLPGVKVEKMPLCRFLDLAGQLSGVAVSVDPVELRLASASAGAEVSVEAKQATIEEIVAAAVKPLRLAVVVEESQLVLRRVGGDKRRSTACPVDDLTGDGPTAEELAGWIQKLVAPETWAAAGGSGKLQVTGGTLQIEQREDVTYEAFILLERYRLARGLATRTKYPAALLTAGGAISERLAAATTFTFSRYTPLREIFRYWQEELEVAVLVDWPALAEDRLWPQTRIAMSAIDKPWVEALDAVLAPLGLGWRPAGARAIQITTLAKVQAEPQLEVYLLAAAAPANAADLEKQVEQLAAADSEGSASKVTTAVAYDAASRVLLVRAPALIQRRLGESLRQQGMLVAK